MHRLKKRNLKQQNVNAEHSEILEFHAKKGIET